MTLFEQSSGFGLTLSILRRRFHQPAAREMTSEGAAVTFEAVDRQRALMPLQRMAHDREPEPRATEFTRAAGIDTIEALGQARDVFGRDAHAGVAHGDVPTVAVRPPVQLDFALRRRV